MLKKIFSKVNNFIQWTKKWHFFQNLIGLNVIGCFLMWILTILIEISNPNKMPINELLFVLLIMTPLFVSGFALFISLPISIFTAIYNYIFKKRYEVKNNFLLNNKVYNIIYYISFIFIILSLLCVFVTGYIELLFMEILLLIIEYLLLLPVYVFIIKKIQAHYYNISI